MQNKIVRIVSELLSRREIIESTNTIRLHLEDEVNEAIDDTKLKKILHT